MKFPYVHFDGATGQIKQLSSSAYLVPDCDCAEIIDPPDNPHDGWIVDLRTVDRGTCRLTKIPPAKGSA